MLIISVRYTYYISNGKDSLLLFWEYGDYIIAWHSHWQRCKATHSWTVLAAAVCLDVGKETPPCLLHVQFFKTFFDSLLIHLLSPPLVLHDVTLFPLLCRFFLSLAIYWCLYLIVVSPFSSYSQPDKEMQGLCCWLPPNLLHNSTVSLLESLLG